MSVPTQSSPSHHVSRSVILVHVVMSLYSPCPYHLSLHLLIMSLDLSSWSVQSCPCIHHVCTTPVFTFSSCLSICHPGPCSHALVFTMSVPPQSSPSHHVSRSVILVHVVMPLYSPCLYHLSLHLLIMALDLSSWSV